MKKIRACVIYLPATSDTPGPKQAEYDQAVLQGEVLSVVSDPELITIVTAYEQAAWTTFGNNTEEAYGPMEPRVLAAELLEAEDDNDRLEIVALGNRSMLAETEDHLGLNVLIGHRLELPQDD